jgi:glutamate-1-semialdehyde 2,1-aminomutase
MFLPEVWPSYYSRAQGVEIWTLDDKRYVDMSYCGIGSTVLGFADQDVDTRVQEAIRRGSMCTLNCGEEVELADLLCELHPWAEMVRFGRCGGETMAMAVRIARASTHRDKVAFCGYHGWHDWYLAANLGDEEALDDHLLPGLSAAGVPRSLAGTSLPFRYNRIDELKAIVSTHKNDIAAIVMEPVRSTPPIPGFLEEVRQIASEIGAVLIFDEVTSGWRENTGGIHLLYGVNPDLAVFAKGMGNGYPMAAVVGIGDVMQAAQRTFISSTYWTERIGPVAALATIRKHGRCNVAAHLIEMGERVKVGWLEAAEQTGLPVHVEGIAPLAHFSFKDKNAQVLKTLFTQFMLEKGFLAGASFYSTFAHTIEHVLAYNAAVVETFSILANAVASNRLEELLKGPVVHSGFARLA